MDRNEQLNTVFSQFDKSAKDFCESINGLACDISSLYNGEEISDNLRNRFAKIYCNSCAVEFKYTAHGALSITNSILECMVYFDKTEKALAVPLPFVVDFLDEDTAELLCIPYISSSEGMEQAFNCIGDVVKSILPKIIAISCDEEQKQAVTAYFYNEFKRIISFTDNVDEKEFLGGLGVDSYEYEFLTMRFSSNPYTLAAKGTTEKAIKQLRKCGELFSYEERIIRLWQAGKLPDMIKMPDIASNMELINNQGVSKEDTKELLPMFISWLVLTVPASVVYLAVYFLSVFIQKQGSVYLTGVMANFPFCIFAGFITAIALSYFTRFWFIKLIYKKDYEKLAELDHISNDVKTDKFVKGFLYVLVVAGVFFSIFTSTWNLNFKQDCFVDNSSFFSIIGKEYSYGDIDYVKYVPDRTNDFGEKLDYPSYMIVMKDGREIDLFDYDEYDNYAPVLKDFLPQQGVRIVE